MTDSLFLTAFAFIFLAALPGRTTFLMLLLSARGNPQTVFVGAALAFAVQSLISVGLGEVLSFLPHTLIEAGAGFLFLFFAWNFWRESREVIEEGKMTKVTVTSVFILIFMAEWGDVSQVAIATYASQHDGKLLIFAAAFLALLAIVVIATLTGSKVGRAVQPRLVQKSASVAFGMTGIYLLSRVAFP